MDTERQWIIHQSAAVINHAFPHSSEAVTVDKYLIKLTGSVQSIETSVAWPAYVPLS